MLLYLVLAVRSSRCTWSDDKNFLSVFSFLSGPRRTNFSKRFCNISNDVQCCLQHQQTRPRHQSAKKLPPIYDSHTHTLVFLPPPSPFRLLEQQRISNALGGQPVLSSVMPVCSELLEDTSSWRRRKAGLLTLFLIGEVRFKMFLFVCPLTLSDTDSSGHVGPIRSWRPQRHTKIPLVSVNGLWPLNCEICDGVSLLPIFCRQGSGQDLADSGLLPELVLGPVLAGMQDEHPRVRNAALSCAEHMMEYPVPDEGSFQEAFHVEVKALRIAKRPITVSSTLYRDLALVVELW